MLARKIDHSIGEPERNFVQREVGERDGLRVDDIAVAIVQTRVAERSERTVKFRT
jgi:hypothetical protein